MFEWLRNRRYKKVDTILIAYLILILFKQRDKVYPAENINLALGHSYYFFDKIIDEQS